MNSFVMAGDEKLRTKTSGTRRSFFELFSFSLKLCANFNGAFCDFPKVAMKSIAVEKFFITRGHQKAT